MDLSEKSWCQHEAGVEVWRWKSPAEASWRILDHGTWSKETWRWSLDPRTWFEDPAKTFPAFPPLPLVPTLPPSAHLLQAPRGEGGGGGGSAQVNDDVKHEFCRERCFALVTKQWWSSSSSEAKDYQSLALDNVDIGKTSRQQNELKISQMVSLSPEE